MCLPWDETNNLLYHPSMLHLYLLLNKIPRFVISAPINDNSTFSSIGVVEVNDLYSSQEAAQICGTPLETDFDNIIYDNI